MLIQIKQWLSVVSTEECTMTFGKMLLDSPATLEEICELFVSTGLDQAFPNLSVIDLRISVTLPVSTAGVERSFSQLKLIKSYL